MIIPAMKPVFSESDVPSSDESFSMSDIFGPSTYISQPEPVRASTPLSSVGDVSANTKDTSCSILSPQNFSLLSEDLSVSSHSVTDHSMSHIQSTPSDDLVEDSPPPLRRGYAYGSMWVGFKILGDNLDKTIKPHDVRSNNQSQSLHYFNLYAVCDRIDFSLFSCESSIIDPANLDMSVFLPSAADKDALFDNFTILISRILCGYFPTLCEYVSSVTQHIPHKYSREMSSKSHVVSTCTRNYIYNCCPQLIIMTIHNNITRYP